MIALNESCKALNECILTPLRHQIITTICIYEIQNFVKLEWKIKFFPCGLKNRKIDVVCNISYLSQNVCVMSVFINVV